MAITVHAVGLNQRKQAQVTLSYTSAIGRLFIDPQKWAEYAAGMATMTNVCIPHTQLSHFPVIFGCADLGGAWHRDPITEEEHRQGADAVRAAVDHGYDFFDHADIYCHGKSEAVFGDVLADKPSLREKIILQTKCGIRFAGDVSPEAPNRFDFSHDHIIASVEGSLKRLRTDYVDILLLHRPDALMEPAEIASAFDKLHQSGKVRHFGVSNHSSFQIDLLKKCVRQPLVVNQVQISLAHPALFAGGVTVNQNKPVVPGDGILDYCRLHDMAVQAWSPLDRGRVCGGQLTPEQETRYRPIVDMVARIAAAKGVSSDAVALAWLLRHPAGISPVIGTRNPARIGACTEAVNVEISREEWYELLAVGRGESIV